MPLTALVKMPSPVTWPISYEVAFLKNTSPVASKATVPVIPWIPTSEIWPSATLVLAARLRPITVPRPLITGACSRMVPPEAVEPTLMLPSTLTLKSDLIVTSPPPVALDVLTVPKLVM